MDSLIKKDSSTLFSCESYLTQTDVQASGASVTSSGAFVADEPAPLPMVQTYKISAFSRSLTARETEILELLGKGLSIKGIARDLAISPGTVKWHVKNTYEKLGATAREDALKKAQLRQLIRW